MKKIISLITILAIILSINIAGFAEYTQPGPEVTIYTEEEFKTLMKNGQPINIESEEHNGLIVPMTEFFFRFDHYTAEHNATSDFQYRMGEFTVYNHGPSPVTASYSQSTAVKFDASFTTTVSASASFKGIVTDVGTSASVSGTLSAYIGTTFTYNTGVSVPSQNKLTITMYHKGVGVKGCAVYAVYDVDRTTLIGYDYRYDTSNCWFPKLNSYTAVVGAPIPINK